MDAYAGFQKRGFALSDRLDAVRHRRALERHDLMEAARRANANWRIEAKHSRDHGADADPASARHGGGRNSPKARQKDRSTARLLFDLTIRHDARTGAGKDLRVGAETSGPGQNEDEKPALTDPVPFALR
jgi:hypothetical protein